MKTVVLPFPQKQKYIAIIKVDKKILRLLFKRNPCTSNKESYKLTGSKQINKKKAQGLTLSKVHQIHCFIKHNYILPAMRNTVFREYKGLHAAL